MTTLMRDILDATSFSAALMGLGWLCIVIGEKMGVQ